MPNSASILLTNANIATLDNGIKTDSIITDGAIFIEQGKIKWLGKAIDFPDDYGTKTVQDCQGKWLLPGFIDCHTHLVFAGNRANEFEQRLQGVSYASIAKQGGGILSTVTATRNCDFTTLLALAKKRAVAMLRQGVTSVEIKSGYGLDLVTERRMLEVAQALSEQLPMTIRKTFLGAHALPPEYKGQADQYIKFLCQEVMPALAQDNLIDAVDVFCESIGFNLEQTEQVFDTAAALGLAIKGHTEQLSAMGGSTLAAKKGALSVDHIEYLQAADAAAMQRSGTIATILPGAFYFLRETQRPPIDLLRQHAIPMAIATDYNPGSSPLASLTLMMNMACTFFGLTVEEALQGVTINAAKALGLAASHGSLEQGKQADIVCWDINHPRDLVYEQGVHQPEFIIKNGQTITATNLHA